MGRQWHIKGTWRGNGILWVHMGRQWNSKGTWEKERLEHMDVEHMGSASV